MQHSRARLQTGWCCAAAGRQLPPSRTLSPAGGLKSPWSHGGAFLTFQGVYPQKSDNEKTYLGRVTKDVLPGARRIPVSAGGGNAGWLDWGVDRRAGLPR